MVTGIQGGSVPESMECLGPTCPLGRFPLKRLSELEGSVSGLQIRAEPWSGFKSYRPVWRKGDSQRASAFQPRFWVGVREGCWQSVGNVGHNLEW